MPLEIREVVIKTTVNENEPANTSGRGSSSPAGRFSDQEIGIIVEKILQILKEKSER